ncbi:MAG: hypothetical protein ACYCQK_06515, partial [Acidiferrobacteraceae bacterium]
MSTTSGGRHLAELGGTLRRSPHTIAAAQSAMTVLYAVLLLLPLLPSSTIHELVRVHPGISHARIDELVRFVFWGLWWPLL